MSGFPYLAGECPVVKLGEALLPKEEGGVGLQKEEGVVGLLPKEEGVVGLLPEKEGVVGLLPKEEGVVGFLPKEGAPVAFPWLSSESESSKHELKFIAGGWA